MLGMDVDLLHLVVQSCIGRENTHTSILEPEVVDAQLSGSLRSVECLSEMSEACGPSAELHGMEVHEVENVLHIDILLSEL